jgi:hypothetical protein
MYVSLDKLLSPKWPTSPAVSVPALDLTTRGKSELGDLMRGTSNLEEITEQ